MSFGWPELVALLTSLGFGALSGIVPVLSAEAYVLASQVGGLAGALPVAIGVAVGQTATKVAMFYAVRRGRELPAMERRRAERRAKPVGPRMQKWRSFVDRMLVLVGDPRWGLPITALAAFVGIPPLYAVALVAGATKMNGAAFTGIVLAGRVLRFVLLALGVGWAVQWWT